MGPPEFTGGNAAVLRHLYVEVNASMRPPEFTGGNWSEPCCGTAVMTLLQ